MLTIQDCIEMSELSEEEILAVAEHENLPEMLALELGNYLVATPEGQTRIKRMICDDITAAQQRGDIKHASMLKLVLRHYLEHHADLA